MTDPQIGLHRGRAWVEEGLNYARKYNDITLIQFFSASLAEMLRLEGQYEQAALGLEEALQTIVYRKLDVKSRAAATRFAIEDGLA